MRKSLLHPNQFQVNEAWIVFRLNDEPIHTERDGSFHVVALMDAASCFIFGSEFVSPDTAEPSRLEARRLLKAGWKHQNGFPSKLLVPTGQFKTSIPAEAERNEIAVVRVSERELQAFIGEARQGFKEHVQGRQGQ